MVCPGRDLACGWMPGARLHFIGGSHVDVDQLPEDAARMLWGREDGDDAHDMGYAPLQYKGKPVIVNPAAVAYVEREPGKGSNLF